MYNYFHRVIFRNGSGCPVIRFYWQCGTLRVSHIILKRKLVFIHHLANLPVGSLSRDFFELQYKEGLPGLIEEKHDHLENLNFEDMRHESKFIWKRVVRDYVNHRNVEELLEDSKKYKKVNYNELKDDEYGRKQYINDLDVPSVNCMIYSLTYYF